MLSPSIMVVPEVHTGILQRLMEDLVSFCSAKRVLKLKQIRPQIPAARLYSIPKAASREAWADRGNSTRTTLHLLLFKVTHCLLKVYMPVCLFCTEWCCALRYKKLFSATLFMVLLLDNSFWFFSVSCSTAWNVCFPKPGSLLIFPLSFTVNAGLLMFVCGLVKYNSDCLQTQFLWQHNSHIQTVLLNATWHVWLESLTWLDVKTPFLRLYGLRCVVSQTGILSVLASSGPCVCVKTMPVSGGSGENNGEYGGHGFSRWRWFCRILALRPSSGRGGRKTGQVRSLWDKYQV